MTELLDWLAALDPTFAFLLALPFAVAAAGAAAEGVRRRRSRGSSAPAQQPVRSQHQYRRTQQNIHASY